MNKATTSGLPALVPALTAQAITPTGRRMRIPSEPEVVMTPTEKRSG
jgi:hypothetical protein